MHGGAPTCGGRNPDSMLIRKRPPEGGLAVIQTADESALASFEARVGLADHEDLATTANHLAVAVTGLRRLQGGQDLHDETSANGWE